MEKGYIYVYTGEGKGKTTAALGLALRAVGAGLSVCVVQFIKSMEYHELRVLRDLRIGIHQFGRGCFIKGDPTDADRALARDGLQFVRNVFQEGRTDVMILDEINVAQQLRLVDSRDVLELVRAKPPGMELICTGRGAPPELIEAADLVTEMVNVKHYYDSGVIARDGIER